MVLGGSDDRVGEVGCKYADRAGGAYPTVAMRLPAPANICGAHMIVLARDEVGRVVIHGQHVGSVGAEIAILFKVTQVQVAEAKDNVTIRLSR